MDIRFLNFDVAKGGIQHRLFVRAGDVKSRTVKATFHSGGERIPFSSAYLRMITADGAEKLNECTVADGSLSYTFKSEELAPGEAVCEFVLISSDGGEMTSPKFTVVSEALLYNGEGAESSDEYEAYIAALMKIDNLTASVVGGDVPTVDVSENEGGGIHLAFALPRGEDGAIFTPSVNADGELSWSNDKGLPNPPTIKVRGSNGYTPVKGKDYFDGKDGYTPERGVDYWTDADKEAIKVYINEQIGNIDEALDNIIALQGSYMEGDR